MLWSPSTGCMRSPLEAWLWFPVCSSWLGPWLPTDPSVPSVRAGAVPGLTASPAVAAWSQIVRLDIWSDAGHASDCLPWRVLSILNMPREAGPPSSPGGYKSYEGA